MPFFWEYLCLACTTLIGFKWTLILVRNDLIVCLYLAVMMRSIILDLIKITIIIIMLRAKMSRVIHS